jgi:hypothetical protein
VEPHFDEEADIKLEQALEPGKSVVNKQLLTRVNRRKCRPAQIKAFNDFITTY